MSDDRLGRPFQLLVVARGIGWFGAAITLVALPLAVFQRTGDAALTAVLTALGAAPYLMLGLFAGVVADRWPRRPTMIVTAIVAGAAIGSVPLAQAAGALTTAHLFIAAFLNAAALVFFDAAGFGLLPSLVARPQLARAVSWSSGAGTVVTLLGPAAAGVLVALFTPGYALAVDAVSAFIGAVVLWFIAEPQRAPRAAGRHLRKDLFDGLSFVWAHRVVRLLTLLGTGNSLAGGFVMGLLVATAVEVYGVDANGPGVGAFYTALGVGTLVGTVVAPRLARLTSAGVIAVIGLAGEVLGLLLWALATAPAVGIGALVFHQCAATVVVLNGITVRHLVTPDDMQGRVNTTARMLAWGGQPLGAAAAGVIVGPLGLVPTLLVATGLLTVTWLVALLSPLRAISRDIDLTAAK